MFEKRLHDAEFLVPPDILAHVKASVFLLMESETSNLAVGVGVFFASDLAVTADHNLEELFKGKESMPYKYVHAECQGQKIVLSVQDRFSKMDYALLKFEGTHSYLEVYTKPPDTLLTRRVALCAFQIGISDHLHEFDPNDLGIMPASVVKVSKHAHHLVIQSDTWPGDSGAALVLHDGCLIGIHLAGVNSLREKFDQSKVDSDRLSELEASLADAAQSVATGCVALYCAVFAGSCSPAAESIGRRVRMRHLSVSQS